MSDDQNSADKLHEPTPQKLLEARRKGDVPKSNDLITGAGYLGLLTALLLPGATNLNSAGSALISLIDRPAQLTDVVFQGSPAPVMLGLILPVFLGLVPLFAFPAALVVLCIFAQRAWVFAPSKLEPKFSRISLISNAKNKFGRSGLFEFAKSATKLCLFSACLSIFIMARLPEMIASSQTSPSQAISLLTELALALVFVITLIAISIGGIDATWQQMEHLRKNRMSHKELQDEAKNTEGDPHLKQERRQRALSAAQNQMMAQVPDADVIVVNPTHYAVALKWSRKAGDAPICIAKGVDELALTIRKIADDSQVPIHSDPPTARSLYSTTEIGQEISPEFFKAVAAAIRFAEDMRKRAKARGRL